MDDLSLRDSARFNHNQLLGSRQLTDLYLLGLAVKHKGKFVTFELGITLTAVLKPKATNLFLIQ